MKVFIFQVAIYKSLVFVCVHKTKNLLNFRFLFDSLFIVLSIML